MTRAPAHPTPADRTPAIALARRTWIEGRATQGGGAPAAPWLVRSWQRCLAAGREPREPVAFEAVTRAGAQQAEAQAHALVAAARPVLDRLSRAIADTRYFAILTDANGIVIDVGALPPGHDAAARSARAIARIGVDLSERAVGTTAIGAALAEREPVWLHRGEHFFEATSIYTCAGAPLFGPQGDCIGMLDLTGVQVMERPALRHLAAQSARSIENALVLAQPREWLLRIRWPGAAPGEAGDGLLCIDQDGCVAGANRAARQMLQEPLATSGTAHCQDLFALDANLLFDAARRAGASIEVPLWSGLRVQVQVERHGAGGREPARPRLRDLETALIRKAVDDARGNVAEAARALGISRATVYRKLARSRT